MAHILRVLGGKHCFFFYRLHFFLNKRPRFSFNLKMGGGLNPQLESCVQLALLENRKMESDKKKIGKSCTFMMSDPT